LYISVVCSIPSLTYGNVTIAQIHATPESHGTVNCMEGYRATHPTVTCMANRQWKPKAECTMVQCAYPGNITNGYYSRYGGVVTSAQPYNVIITVNCNTGYELVEGIRTTRQCLSDGKWDGSTPVCGNVACNYPGNVVNGLYTSTNNNDLYSTGSMPYMSNITLKCVEGYESNRTIRTCLANKSWSGTAPSCQRIYCPSPNDLTHGHYTFENITTYAGAVKLAHGTKLHAVCNTSYMVSKPSSYITCQLDHTWTKPAPTCDLIKCDLPTIIEGVMRNFSTPLEEGNSAPHNASLSESCGEKYRPQTNSRRCDDTGSFDGSPLICGTSLAYYCMTLFPFFQHKGIVAFRFKM